MSAVQVFVSFDVEHDRDLFEQLCAQSGRCGFDVLAGSEGLCVTDLWSDRVRSRICEADQMIVICGEHTEASMSMSAELRIAQQERTPYILLWGRREIMCKKPVGAKTTEGMYSWTREILRDQIVVADRKAHADLPARGAHNVR